MVKAFFFTILFVSWLVFITFLSLFFFTGEMSVPRLNIPHIDKIVHFLFYFIFVVLGVKAVREIFKVNLELKKVLLYTVTFACSYGIIIELLQYAFTESRQGDILDVLANSMGALAGMFLVKRLVFKGWSLK
ncbi:VanZ family protein [Maribacter antarcticus]|uniref:VanZ family protein n=1 Tax=Maribacter antarcticus TaxID=505250 RepID=UPI0012EB0657|nr:VanZ family protein [Maribacter antarcticus]